MRRQCKASLYEGGIRVPGILEWPAAIKENRQTTYPAYVSDYLPTVLDVLGEPAIFLYQLLFSLKGMWAADRGRLVRIQA
jgi:arylsulfatase A-like enzyme